jgi:hypothetical protein
MSKSPKPKPDDPEQSKRFVEMAKKAGADAESPIFDKVLRKVAATPRDKDDAPKLTPKKAK